MIKPDLPANEAERLKALLSYDVMDSLPEEDYDCITEIASEICQTPISLITLIDDKRQWFKSKVGLKVDQTPRDVAFCAHAILEPEKPLIVPDFSKDDRFKSNPLATGDPNVEFYAGIPLVNSDGFPLGSLCVIDNQPREISERQIAVLKSLAKQVVNLLELRKTVKELKKTQQKLVRSNNNLEEFAYIVSHDIKAPLRNVKMLSEVIGEDYAIHFDEKGKKYLSLLQETANESIEFINGVLNYSKAIHHLDDMKEEVDLHSFVNGIIGKINAPDNFEILIVNDLPKISISKIALQQIFTNLFSNSIKYNDKKKGWIKVASTLKEKGIDLEISDNGKGIPTELLDSIFSLFYMVDKKEAKRQGSTGIGLSIVKKLVDQSGGKVVVKSALGVGTTFTISLPLV